MAKFNDWISQISEDALSSVPITFAPPKCHFEIKTRSNNASKKTRDPTTPVKIPESTQRYQKTSINHYQTMHSDLHPDNYSTYSNRHSSKPSWSSIVSRNTNSSPKPSSNTYFEIRKDTSTTSPSYSASSPSVTASSDLSSLTMEIDSLKREIQALKASTEITGLKEEIQSLKAVIAELRSSSNSSFPSTDPKSPSFPTLSEKLSQQENTLKYFMHSIFALYAYQQDPDSTTTTSDLQKAMQTLSKAQQRSLNQQEKENTAPSTPSTTQTEEYLAQATKRSITFLRDDAFLEDLQIHQRMRSPTPTQSSKRRDAKITPQKLYLPLPPQTQASPILVADVEMQTSPTMQTSPSPPSPTLPDVSATTTSPIRHPSQLKRAGLPKPTNLHQTKLDALLQKTNVPSREGQSKQ